MSTQFRAPSPSQAPSQSPAPSHRGEPLTRRERAVLSILDEGVTLTEIARQLEVTRNTVKSHVRSVYKKLGVSTRTAAADHARALGLR